jgi:hypothetical protein
MRPPRLHPLPAPVADLLARVNHWRATRTKLGPMAKELWAEAGGLARVHGVNAIAGILRLNYEALRAWTEEGSGSEQPARQPEAPEAAAPRRLLVQRKCRAPATREEVPDRKQSFLRLDPFAAITAPCSAIEVIRPDGTKMAIQLTGSTVVDMVALVEAFLKRR